jgi:hypothetical protein
MMRPTSMIWLGVIVLTGVAVFSVKHEVSLLEEQLHKTRKATAQDRDAIHVLNAEWSFLNQPTRLADLSRRHLPQLQPIATAQFGDAARLDTLPWKPGDPNAPEAAPAVAETKPAAKAAAPPAQKPAAPAPPPKPAPSLASATSLAGSSAPAAAAPRTP